MLWSVRATRLAEARCALETHALLGPRARVHAFLLAGLVSEDLLHLEAFRRVGRLERPVAAFVLEGRAVVRVGKKRQEIFAGQAFFLDSRAAFSMRQEGPRYRSVVAEWDRSEAAKPRGPLEVWTLEDAHGERMEALWERLRGAAAERPTVRSVWTKLDAALRARGIAGPEVAAFGGAARPTHARVAAAVDTVISDLAREPMQVDLEALTGLSSRHLRRLVQALHEVYGYNATTWRDARNRRRLMLAVAMLGLGAHRARDVSRWVGYRTPQTMARAFSIAGYPPPSQVRARTEALGRI